ncbi:hypothetical protein AB0H34_03085 [Saccharopolyspora shandongensis]|uniref:hypothetical protein n=1 Tax=Saccharopolyspora shandongensis TaxID=418495 RepID=UPI0034086996
MIGAVKGSLRTWGATARLASVLLLVLVALLVGAWAFGLTIDIGPIRLSNV